MQWDRTKLNQVHQKVIDSGLFDRIQHSDYRIGDIVAIRFNDIANTICAVHEGDHYTIYDGKIQREISKDDIRPVGAYVRVVGQIIHPTKEMDADRHGHGVTRHFKDASGE